MKSSPLTVEIKQALRVAVRGGVCFDPVIRGIHATDASHYQMTPACVVIPRDNADVVAALKIATAYKMPITPRGGGTALSGQTFGPGMVLDLSRHMTRVLEVNPTEGWARVEASVVRDQLNCQLAAHGLQYAPDPATTSRATIGGMIGNNSAGMRSIVYGKTIDRTLGCQVALADGTVHNFAPADEGTFLQAAAGDTRSAQFHRAIANIIAQHSFDLVVEYGGAFTGEHGDGQLRGEFVPKFFGA